MNARCPVGLPVVWMVSPVDLKVAFAVFAVKATSWLMFPDRRA